MPITLKKLLKDARLEYRNARGRGLRQKYVVIESDDWGSIRQPSKNVYLEQVERFGKEIDDPFFRYDSVETDEDLEVLFAVLEKHTDCNGHPAVITADYAVANPSFASIRKSGFGGYTYETIDQTYAEYDGSGKALSLALQGLERGIWKPQLHCREHLQIARWMKALQDGDPEVRWAFEHNMISTANAIEPLNHYAFMDAFAYSEGEYAQVEGIVSDAAKQFRRLFGYDSKTFVASCYVWNDALERALKKYGIHSMQAGWYQWIPDEKNAGGLKKKRLYMGMRSANQSYTVRNCLFEPSLFGADESAELCMRQIASAFRCGQPAIISSHRVNYMSRLEQSNRTTNLKLLNDLLGKMLSRWPDIMFVSSDQLAEKYEGNDHDN